MKHPYPSCALPAAALLAPCALLAVTIDSADYAASFNVKFSGYTGTTTLTDFPALVRLSAARNGFDYAKCAADGSDIRFTDAEGNLIPHEIDTWDTMGESLVWVKVAALNRRAVVRCFYGYQGAGAQPAVTAADVWSNGYVGVWHLGEISTPLKESSGVSTPFDTASGSPGYAQSGAVGGAVNFSTGNLKAAHDADLDGFTNCTFEMWTKKTSHQNLNNNVFFLNKRTSSSSNLSYFIYDQYDTNEKPHARVFAISTNGTSSLSYGDRSRYPELDAWVHNAFVRRIGASIDSYLDGIISTSSTWPTAAPGMGTGPLFAGDAPLILGANQSNGGRYPGRIDELRISNVARSDDWIKASHDCVTVEGYAVYELGKSDNDWAKYTHKFPVTFENYAGAALTDFPVLVRISESSISGFDYDDCLRPNGADLRFADEGGNLLASEVDTWNTNGTSLVWVKVPTLNASTKLTAYYGWASGPLSDSAEVWDTDYKAVWHMNGTALQVPDSTQGMADLQSWRSGGYNASKINVAFTEGIAGNAAEFGVYSDKIGCLATRASSCMLTNEAACTVELWMIQDDHDPTSPTGRYLMKEILGSKGIFTMYEYKTSEEANLKYNGEMYAYVTGNKQCWMTGYTPIVTPTRAEWHYFVIRYDSADESYANILDCVKMKAGTYAGTGRIYYDSSSVDTLYVGASQSADTSWPGKIDEVRISKVARSDAWLQATHDTISGNGFTSCGAALANVRSTVLLLR